MSWTRCFATSPFPEGSGKQLRATKSRVWRKASGERCAHTPYERTPSATHLADSHVWHVLVYLRHVLHYLTDVDTAGLRHGRSEAAVAHGSREALGRRDAP